MHAPPYFQTTVSRFGVWRSLSAGLGIASTLSTGAWLAGSLTWGWPAAATVTGWIACISLIAMGAWRQKPVHIRWDTQAWHLALEATLGDPVRGRLDLAVDGGSWMLLRFVPDGGSELRDAVWLPAQRRGHENTWHALRATLYGARPTPDLLSATLP